jgi:putative DNA primase/helicase
MNFERFAELHGLVISNLIYDKWVRVPTTDKPNSRNGAYIFDGKAGAIQNWAIHEKPVRWQSEDKYVPDPDYAKKKAKALADKTKKQEDASKKAGWIMHQVKSSTHPYLDKKGFVGEKGYVWNDLLIIPMRVNGNLVGCQMIAPDGTKKFLTGQITKGASAVIENKGLDIICEGYATALSVRRCMKFLKKRYTIHVAFSAGNVSTIANNLKKFIVVADNDVIGIKTAKSTGKPYWLSDVDGEDFNDFEMRLGTESASLVLSALV